MAYASDNTLRGARYTADKSLEGTKYGADKSLEGTQDKLGDKTIAALIETEGIKTAEDVLNFRKKWLEGNGNVAPEKKTGPPPGAHYEYDPPEPTSQAAAPAPRTTTMDTPSAPSPARKALTLDQRQAEWDKGNKTAFGGRSMFSITNSPTEIAQNRSALDDANKKAAAEWEEKKKNRRKLVTGSSALY
jgi:hypothetical protein